jgi:MurNAc alpha-1-phosphate uridylyltransferase
MSRPKTAMVLAAGLGKRMRPITDRIPKPLVEIAGRTLIDRGLDALDRAGVARIVVNVHHLADQLVGHLALRNPAIIVSDERDALLESGGGIVRALPLLGDEPFFVVNADTFWIDGPHGAELDALALAWDDARMDSLLMLVPIDRTTGHTGGTDFLRDPDGRLSRAKGDPSGYVYAGAAILHPRLFVGASTEAHSLNREFDAALSAGRLHGHVMAGDWITVGTPDAIEPAEKAVERAQRGS